MMEHRDFEVELIALAPELIPRHDELMSWWDPDHPPTTVWTGDMGNALGVEIELIPESRLREIFALIEAAMLEGTDELKTSVATGLLEALANHVSAGRLSAKSLASLVGPESGSYLKAWDEFTMGEALADYGDAAPES